MSNITFFIKNANLFWIFGFFSYLCYGKQTQIKINMKKNLVYKMSEIDKMFTKDQVEKMSSHTEFNYEDPYFHCDIEEGWIESLTDEDINFYNQHVENDKKLVKVTKLNIVA